MDEREPLCAACGRPISVCAADPERCAPAIEASQEARDESVRVYWSIGDPIRNIAAALQRHMDETEFYRGMADGRKERMAALIAEVREWLVFWRDMRLAGPDELAKILAKYEDKP